MKVTDLNGYEIEVTDLKVQKTGIVYHPQRIKVSHPQRVKVNH